MIEEKSDKITLTDVVGLGFEIAVRPEPNNDEAWITLKNSSGRHKVLRATRDELEALRDALTRKLKQME